MTTNENGIKTASALYKAFGETRYALGNLGTDYKFTGQREEASLGIYFFNARWYDGTLGRFLSPDSIVPTSTQGTQAWDRYAFVNNNPVRYNDPTGHDIGPIIMAGGAALMAIGFIMSKIPVPLIAIAGVVIEVIGAVVTIVGLVVWYLESTTPAPTPTPAPSPTSTSTSTPTPTPTSEPTSTPTSGPTSTDTPGVMEVTIVTDTATPTPMR